MDSEKLAISINFYTFLQTYIFRWAHMGRPGTGRHDFLICLFVKFPHFNMLLNKLERCFTISLDNLFTLLSSPSLSYIFISYYENLTENVLQRVANLHGFRNLEYLYLSNCISLTKNWIDFFPERI